MKFTDRLFRSFFSILILVFFTHAFPAQLVAQFGYPLGLNPGTTKWYQINTDSFRIVYPESVQPKAQRVANLVSVLYSKDQTIGDKRQKVSIFLHPQSVVPNGFVSLIPFRSEFYLTPPQASFLGHGDWLDLLTIHEYRHIQQSLNAKRGATKVASWFFGQTGWAFLRVAAIPRWFMEGDAVLYETLLSNSGRGRQPMFDMEFRAMRLEGRHYNYEKTSARSLKDYVPDHYALGYYLVTYARKQAGADIWKHTVQKAGAYDDIVFPFSQELKQKAGYRTPELYRAAMEDIDKQWEEADRANTYTEARIINKAKPKFTSYQHARHLSDDEMLVQKSAFDEIPTLYKISSGGDEERLFVPGFQIDASRYYSLANGQLYFTELRYDERWGNQNYSDVFVYNLYSEKKRRLTKKQKLFSPDIRTDGSQLVAVEVPAVGSSRLVVLDGFSGKRQAEIQNPNDYFFINPRWLPDGKSVAVVAQKNSEQALLQIEVATGNETVLVPFAANQIIYPQPSPDGQWVIYTSAETGINNLFAVNIETKEKYQVTSDRFGALQPSISPDGTQIVYSGYTSLGYDLKEAPFAPDTWKKVTKPLPSSINFYQSVLEQQPDKELTDVPDNAYTTKRYREAGSLFNVHSLLASPLHPNYQLSLQAANEFSTFSGAVGANYNANDDNTTFFANAAYGRYYPVFEVGASVGTERDQTYFIVGDTQAEDTISIFTPIRTWKERTFYGGIILPINLSSGSHFANLQLQSRLGVLYRELESDIITQANGQFQNVGTALQDDFEDPLTTTDLRLSFTRTQLTATQHIFPRFAQTFDMRFRKTLNEAEGQVFSFSGNLFFPGLFKTHSFWLGTAYQRELTINNYQFPDFFFYPRGYSSIASRDQVTKYQFNYAFPLFYPDIAIGSFFFVQRVKANLFYDTATLSSDPFPTSDLDNFSSMANPSVQLGRTQTFTVPEYNLRSLGAEITFDFRFLRLLDMDMGVRWSYLQDASTFGISQSQFEIVINSLGF